MAVRRLFESFLFSERCLFWFALKKRKVVVNIADPGAADAFHVKFSSVQRNLGYFGVKPEHSKLANVVVQQVDCSNPLFHGDIFHYISSSLFQKDAQRVKPCRYSMIFALKAYIGERSLREQFKARHAINDCKARWKVAICISCVENHYKSHMYL